MCSEHCPKMDNNRQSCNMNHIEVRLQLRRVVANSLLDLLLEFINNFLSLLFNNLESAQDVSLNLDLIQFLRRKVALLQD